MPFGNRNETSKEFPALSQNKEPPDESDVVDEFDDEVEVFEGVDFTKFVNVRIPTKEEAEKRAALMKAKVRPINYVYIEQMKREGVSEELAIKAFIGRFGGNESQTKFFLNADFYYGSDAPTPLTRLIKAREENTLAECIELIEDTKISWDYGDHF